MENALTKDTALAAQDTSSHHFELVAGGKVLDAARLLAVALSTRVNRIPTALVHLLDGDAASQTFETSMLPALGLGANLSVWTGYGDERESAFEGQVVAQSIKARGGKASVLVLELQHKAIRMARGRRSQLYLDMTEAQLAASIGQRHGIDVIWDGPQGEKAEKIAQFNVSDWDFLVSRAEARGCVVLVEGEKVRVAPPKAEGPAQREIVFGQDVYDFEAAQDSRFAYQNVEALAWDFENQMTVEKTASSSPTQNNGDNHALHYTGHLPEDGWKDWLDGVRTRMDLSGLRGHFVIKGDASLRIGNRVALRGFGENFDRTAYISGLVHKLDGGNWLTDVEVGLMPEPFGKYHDVLDEPIGGLIPAIRGLVIGVVKGLEDREGHHRLEIHIPSLDPNRHIMARLAQPEAGKGRGAFFFPQVGDEVVVGFLEEDPNNPIVLGSLYSANQAPPFANNEAHNHRGLLSPENLKVEFDDANKAIVIETPEKLRITLGKQSIKLERGDDLIEMKPGACTIDIKGDLTLKAQSISLVGDTKIEAQAPSVMIQDKTQGKLSLNGGTAMLDGIAIYLG